MNVLSLFDGISGTQVALDRLGVKVNNYYASEIDEYAMKTTLKNYPSTIMLGDVKNWETWHLITRQNLDWSSIDLVVGGFPCQAWSNAGLKQGDKDPRGMLFWTMLDVMKLVLEKNPNAKFLMENVRMKNEFEEYITFHTEEALGKVNKHLINSALVSAQNRKRFYWTNIEGIDQPEDQGLLLRDVLDYSCEDTLSEKEMAFMLRSESKTKDLPRLKARARYEDQKSNTLTYSMHKGVPYNVIGWVDRDKSYCIDANYYKGGNPKSYFEKGRRQLIFNRPCELRDFDSKAQCHHIANATDINGNESIKRVYADSGKSPTLTTMGGGHREPKVLIIPQKVKVRKYEVDIPKLQQTLRDHKKMTILTNKNLADLLDVPVTKVEHWFRTDSSFAIPSEDIWFRLKDLLVIKTDEFDKSIVCFEVRDGKFDMADRVYSQDGKSPTIVASNVAKVMDQPTYRKLTPTECEKLQTFPIGYTEGISNTQRYKALGNSFTVSVIQHILSNAFSSNV
jgi:DNA (cytosine-5)-methyltransferase 1/DNA (cytosine-5)-methyltransferase 3A